jgi:hypothetical protein
VGPLASVLAGLPAGSAFVGDPAAEQRETIRKAVPGAVFPGWARFLAPTLATEALRRAAAGGTVAPSALRPLYLRPADIRPPRP